jgi:hypothetical protein
MTDKGAQHDAQHDAQNDAQNDACNIDTPLSANFLYNCRFFRGMVFLKKPGDYVIRH